MLWRCRDRDLEVGGDRARVMGILNTTPDSFSDGGRFLDVSAACDQARRLAEAGADILDVGGESTRPGATPVPVDEELRRVIPVITDIASWYSGLISIDTTKADVARAALDAGAHIINDVSAMTADPVMVSLAVSSRAGMVLMHRQGTPETMQVAPTYTDVVRDVRDYLRARIETVVAAGGDPERLVVDPGIGFGKTTEHNLALLQSIPMLRTLGCPVLIGVSRKRLFADLLGRKVDERLAGSLGAVAYARAHGASVFRVHDVKETCDLLKVMDMLNHERV